METFLGAHDLQGLISPDSQPPVDVAQLEVYRLKNCQALNSIQSTINEDNIEIISDITNARDAYQAICVHHGDTGGLSTAAMFYDLVNL